MDSKENANQPLKPVEVAIALGVTEMAIRQRIAAGKIPRLPGSVCLVDRSWVKDHLEAEIKQLQQRMKGLL